MLTLAKRQVVSNLLQTVSVKQRLPDKGQNSSNQSISKRQILNRFAETL